MQARNQDFVERGLEPKPQVVLKKEYTIFYKIVLWLQCLLLVFVVLFLLKLQIICACDCF